MNILEIKNVTYNYSNSNEKVLSSVNQKFEIGKFYAIIGKSGAGKSTLLSLLAGLDKPKKGQILFKGNDIAVITNNIIIDFRLFLVTYANAFFIIIVPPNYLFS